MTVDNKILISEKYIIQKNYVKMLKNLFKFKVETMDFRDSYSVVETINDWLETNVNQENQYLFKPREL